MLPVSHTYPAIISPAGLPSARVMKDMLYIIHNPDICTKTQFDKPFVE
jgi:hypothetical protein